MSDHFIDKVLKQLKLPKEDVEQIRKVLKQPEAVQAFDSLEVEEIARRKALLAELSTAEARFAKPKSDSYKACVAAAKRFDDAESELKAAKKNLDAMRAQESAIDSEQGWFVRKIEDELLSGADYRLQDFKFELGNLFNRVRMKCDSWFEFGDKDWLGRTELVHANNLDKVEAANSALKAAEVRINELKMAAVTRHQVTEELRTLIKTLVVPLQKLGMHPMQLDEYCNIKEPRSDD